MKQKNLILTLWAFLPLFAFAQEQPQEVQAQQEEKQYASTLEGQFDQLIEKSGNWEKYKIVKKESLYGIKKTVLDSLREQKNLLREKQDTISAQSLHIKQLQTEKQTVEENLAKETQRNDSIDFLGITLEKGLYSAIVWGIIIFLAILLAVFVSKFSRSNNITRAAMKDLEELQAEYEEYRAKSIEREQKVRRQLQDEINKHRS